MTQQPAHTGTRLRCRIYSQYAAEQAAYEIMHYWFEKMEKRLAKESGNVMTGLNAVCGHTHWLLDGRMVSGPSVRDAANPLPAYAADDHTPEDCIEGLGKNDLLELAYEAKAWLENPTFIRLPDDHYMGTPMAPAEIVETRQVKGFAQPLRPYAVSNMVDVVVNDDKQLVRVAGKECLIKLDIPKHAMIAGSGYVKHIRMKIPQLDIVGQPSCFETLDEVSLINHLCYGTGYSPLHFASWRATYEVVSSEEEVSLEYTLSIPPEIVRYLTAMGV